MEDTFISDTEAANLILEANVSKPACPPLCKDCHWVSVPASREHDKYKCFAPENYAGINLLDGEKVYRYSCADLRSKYMKEICSPHGIWFKHREPKPIIQVTTNSSNIEPTIASQTGSNISSIVSKIKPGSIKRLSKEDLENI